MPCMQLFGKPFSVLSRRVSFVRKSWHINPFCVPIQTDVPSAYAQLYFRAVSFPRDYPSQTLQFPPGNPSYPKSPFCPPMMSWPGFISMAKLMARLRFSSGKSSLRRKACPFFRPTKIQVFQIHTNQDATIGKGKAETDRFGRETRQQRRVCPLDPIALYFV